LRQSFTCTDVTTMSLLDFVDDITFLLSSTLTGNFRRSVRAARDRVQFVFVSFILAISLAMVWIVLAQHQLARLQFLDAIKNLVMDI